MLLDKFLIQIFFKKNFIEKKLYFLNVNFIIKKYF
jgi:hypothetical protein